VPLGPQTDMVRAPHDGVQATEVIVKREDRTDGFCLCCIDDETPGLRIRMWIVTQGRVLSRETDLRWRDGLGSLWP
jgi:hypothetical protein